MTESQFQTRQVVSHYRILEKQGGGGMGVVYKAEDIRLRRPVALKCLPPHLAQDAVSILRFRREAEAASAMNHPDHQASQHLSDGKWPGQDSRLRPGQGFTGTSASDNAVTLGTLEIDPEHLTSPGSTLGTIAYMSPEQARAEELDARTDLFSFGAVLYEMATGTLPFRGERTALIFKAILDTTPVPAARLNSNLPTELEESSRKLWRKIEGCDIRVPPKFAPIYSC